MTLLAIFGNSTNEISTLAASRSLIQKESVHAIFNFIPHQELKQLFTSVSFNESKLKLLDQTVILWPNQNSRDSISLKAEHQNYILDFAQINITCIAKTNSTKLQLELKTASTTIGTTVLQIDTHWSLRTTIIRLPRFVESEHIELKIKNLDKSAVEIKNITVNIKSNISSDLLKSMTEKYTTKTIITDSNEIERICSKNYHTVNISKNAKNIELPKSYPYVSILTPTYNGLQYVKKCADHILKNVNTNLIEWLILDDGSTDGTDTFIQNIKANNIRLVKPQQPIKNFSKANNILAAQAKGQYLLCLNNDCYVQPGWLESLLEWLQTDTTVGVVGSLLLFPETRKIQHCGVVFVEEKDGPLPGHIFHNQILEHCWPYVSQSRLYQAVTGASMIIPKHIYNAVGGFNENYIFGYEDIDLCLKIKRAGYKIVFEPKSLAYHEQGGTLDDPKRKEKRHQEFLHNKKIFQKQWGNTPHVDAELHVKQPTLNIYTPQKNQLQVIYVPVSRGDGHDIYRTDHAVLGLKENGANAIHLDLANLPANIDAIVYQRLSMQPHFINIFEQLKKKYPNAFVGYDIDDYIFDKNIAHESKLDQNIIHSAHFYEQFMRLADFFTTTTSYLADRIRAKFNKTTFVVSNAIPDQFYRDRNLRNSNLIIGYASGTHTHDEDFNLIIPSLSIILRRHPNVKLRIMGHLALPPDFMQHYRSQIECLEFVKFSEFPNHLARFDINLAPLTPSPFNRAKSPLKYLEAGALGIPTIASDIDGYREVIQNGLNGILCQSEQDWVRNLTSLIEHPDLKERIGINAKKDISKNFSTKIVGKKLKSLLTGLVHPGYQCK